METLVEHALIVDSSLASRRELTKDIHQAKMSQNIYEAKSVADGIEQLLSGKMQACFIGPSVSETKAVDFIKAGVRICSGGSCAFIGVLKQHQQHAQSLIDAGAHATLSKPYSVNTFSEVVQKAVVTAREVQLAKSSNNTRIIQVDLPLVVVTLAAQLREIRAALLRLAASNPQWKIGESEKTTLNKVFLEAISAATPSKTPNSSDEIFAAAASQWFFDRLALTTKEANERLRNQLLRTLN